MFGDDVTDLLHNGSRCGHSKVSAQRYVLSGATGTPGVSIHSTLTHTCTICLVHACTVTSLYTYVQRFFIFLFDYFPICSLSISCPLYYFLLSHTFIIVAYLYLSMLLFMYTDRTCLHTISTLTVNSMEEISALLESGESQKRKGATAMNDRSSRAHALFIMTLDQKDSKTDRRVKSQLFLADLGGCDCNTLILTD